MAVGSMNELLTQIKSELLRYKERELRKIGSHFKKGVFAPNEILPACAIIPDYEECGRPYTGKYKVRRGVSVEFWVDSLKIKSAVEVVMGLAEHAKEIFQRSTRLHDQVLDIEYGQVVLGTGPGKLSFMQKVALPLVFTTKDSIPTSRTEWMKDDMTENSALELADVIFADLQELKKDDRDKFQSVVSLTAPPQLVNRQLALLVHTEDMDHDWAGAEGVHRTFEILYSTSLFASEKSLEDNLGGVEAIKDKVFANLQWNGRCINSWIPRVDFGVSNMRVASGLGYVSALTLETVSREVL